MISGAQALKVGTIVASVGVDMDVCNDATCFEEPTQRPNETEFLKKVARDPMLARYQMGDMEVAFV